MKALFPFFGVLLFIGLVVKHFSWLVALCVVFGLVFVVWYQTTSVPAARKRLDHRTASAGPVQRARAREPSVRPAIIRRSLLTRANTGIDARDQVFTAVDLETTGLSPLADRIVEVGLVKFRGTGEVIDEFATLVNNPGPSAEARSRHQIEDKDLTGAPTIDSVLPEVFAFMAGTVVVAHKLEFEEGFLAAAARRSGISFPALTGVCTLLDARRQLDGRAYSLLSLYKTATGEWPHDKHTALGDARAVREVLLWMMRTAPQPLHLTVAASSVSPSGAEPLPCAISCRPVPIAEASVAALLASFPQSPTPRAGDPVELERYRALLADCCKDGRLTPDEATALSVRARRTRVNGTQLRSLHRDAWLSAFGEDARRDWTTLTRTRRREMWLLADALGLTELASHVEAAIQSATEATPTPQARYLRGIRVGILGDGPELRELRNRAGYYGATIAVRITKTVVWAATKNPDANNAAHRAARGYQVPLLTPMAARQRLDAAIRAAQLKDVERQRSVDSWAAERKARDDYWRPTWRPTELDYDPDPVRQIY